TIRAAAADRSQLLGIGHDRITRRQAQFRYDAGFERDYLRLAVAAQNARRHQSRNIDTTHLRRTTPAITGSWRTHRARYIREYEHVAFDHRAVPHGRFRRIDQRLGYRLRHCVACVEIRREQLVRKYLGLLDELLVSQPLHDDVRQLAVFEHPMASERVEVH